MPCSYLSKPRGMSASVEMHLRPTLVLSVLLCAAVCSFPAEDPAAEEEAKPEAEEETATPVGEAEEPDKPSTKKPGAYNTDKFKNVNIDEILKSERLLNNYFKCLMDRGPCTPEGAELKRVLPDALQSNCSKCSESQRADSDKVLEFIIRNKKKQWEELRGKYDPESKYEEYLAKFKQEKGIIED